MDETINRLFQIERDSEDVATHLAEEKQKLKTQYDKKKSDYLSSTREELDKKLENMCREFEKERQHKKEEINRKYEANVQRIEHIVDADEYHFTDQFLEGLTKLGVASDE